MSLERGDGARSAYRRSARLLQLLTAGADLSEYRARLDGFYEDGSEMFEGLYEALQSHGFDMLPYEEARSRSAELRRTFDARLEFLIDELRAPRGFWGHTVGHRLESMADFDVPGEQRT